MDMKEYRVISFFTDLQDNNYPYRVGDTYPRKGGRTNKKRIEELLGEENRQKKRLIEAVEKIKSFEEQ